jgi:plastocyanin
MNRRYLVGVAVLVLSLGSGCGDDAAGPEVDREVRVERARFFPEVIDVTPGAKIRWVNVLPRTAENERTVTSGTGKEDPDAGDTFDVTLRGYASGEARGETFVFEFIDRGTFTYFSRLPDGEEFFGTVTVR